MRTARVGLTWLGLLAGVVTADGQTLARAAANESANLRPAQLRGIASSRTFENVNRNDARVALKVWLDLVAKEHGYSLDSTMDILDGVEKIRQRLESHSADLVALTAEEFLELEGTGLLSAVMTDARSGQRAAAYSYVVLTGANSGITSLAGLRGKNVLVSSRGGGRTGMVWLEVQLAKEKLGRAEQFFGSVKSYGKPQGCILPLFFGMADACVMDEVSVGLAEEMNPQLGRMQVVARSRPMIECVIGTSTDALSYQSELMDAMLGLPATERGRQLLMVFKTERLRRLQPGDLDSARELWRDYYRLAGTPAAMRENR